MALVLSNGCRFTIRGSWTNGRPIHTVWHTITTTLASRVAGVEEVAALIATAWSTNVLPIMFDNYRFQTVGFVDLSSEDGATGDFSMPTEGVGGQASLNESPYNGIVITKDITDKGRGRRGGRTFLPGIQALNVDEAGIVDASVRNSAVAALQAFLTQVNGYSGPNVASNRLVVAHTPFVTVTETKSRKVAAKDGFMTSSEITGFGSKQLVSGIRKRISG